MKGSTCSQTIFKCWTYVVPVFPEFDGCHWKLIGFIEAEGSFYITKKDSKRYVHGFGITQKKDEHILILIQKELHIKAHVKKNKNGFYTLDTTNQKTIKYIKDFFFKTMKSRKSLIYRVWARSFRDKGNFDKLKKIQSFIRKLK